MELKSNPHCSAILHGCPGQPKAASEAGSSFIAETVRREINNNYRTVTQILNNNIATVIEQKRGY